MHASAHCSRQSLCSDTTAQYLVTMAALFGQSGDGRREPKSLVEFRAGKMKQTGTTVTADTRKGLAFMKMEDGLLHFLWKDRKSGEVVDVSEDRGRGADNPICLFSEKTADFMRIELIGLNLLVHL